MNNNNDSDTIFQTIYKKNKLKELNKLRIYNIILKRCEKKIKWAANNNQFYIFFEIPKFCLNCPIYNISECTYFIKHKLQNKFKIIHFTPDILVNMGLNNEHSQLTDILIISWHYIKDKLNKLYY